MIVSLFQWMGVCLQCSTERNRRITCINLALRKMMIVSSSKMNSFKAGGSDGTISQVFNAHSTPLSLSSNVFLRAGVYGDCGGAWVNEDYPLNNLTESAKARLAAEDGWLDLGHSLGVSVQVMRLGGIYGPGRSALDTIIKQDSLSAGQRMRETRKYTSRVHVADICQALKASINKPSLGKIYNVVDDDPAPREEVFTFARTLVQEKWPDHIRQGTLPDDGESVIQKKITRGEKRVRNDRMKNELGVRLLHPTYKSGLQSIIESMDCPFESR